MKRTGGTNRREGGGGLPAAFQVVPQPREVTRLAGVGLRFGQLRGVHAAGGVERPVMGPILSVLPSAPRGGKGVLSLRIARGSGAPGRGGGVPESPEAYVLRLENGGVEIVSRGAAGLFSGCQTLEQLLEDARDTGSRIPACRIVDYPALTYRAAHIDVKHHLDTMKYYYDAVDRLARCKINAIIFEFEDKLRYRRRPLVGGPLSMGIEEMAALTRYARDRHIEISPLVQGLGHATFILKHPEYAHLREAADSDWAFCPMLDETYDLQFDLYRDAMEATPGSSYLHVGGDEVGEMGKCERCRAVAGKEGGTLGLYLRWLNRVSDFAVAHGRTPIFWDDVILKEAGVYMTTGIPYPAEETAALWEKGVPILERLADRFPKRCVYMRWNYSLARFEGNYRALDWYRAHGLRAMIATAAQTASALLPHGGQVAAIRSFVNIAAERRIDGMLCTAWDDASPHMETYWRGLVAAGEFSWSPTGRSLEEYERAFWQRELGPGSVGAAGMEEDLSHAAGFWYGALLAKGSWRWFPGHVCRTIDLPDRSAPGKWAAAHAERLGQAERNVRLHGRISRGLRRIQPAAIRNRYHVDILNAVNDFQVTPSVLLLALREFDAAPKGGKKGAGERVRQTVARFEERWATLQEVYARTRFPKYPDGFVKGHPVHLADLRPDLSWMVTVETEFVQRVREWMKDEE